MIRRNFTIIDAEQRSPEWFAARCGRLTGSVAKDMLATIKSGEAAARRDLRVALIVERVTGRTSDTGYTNDAMRWGIEQEADALMAYEVERGVMVRRTGFLSDNDLMIGTSLDGDIDDFLGIVEAKCPKSATHLEYVKDAKRLVADYDAQVTHSLWVSGADWADLVSYDPRFPPELSLVIARVERDEKKIAAYELAASLFLAEVDRGVEEIRALMEAKAAA